MRVAAEYHDGQSSRSRAVTLDFTPVGVTLVGEGFKRFIALQEITVGARLGNLPREVRFADGGACAVADNEALEQALALAGMGTGRGWLHRLEQHWVWAIGALAAVLVLSALAIIYGIPYVARQAAQAVPPETDERIGTIALEELDDHVFEPSELPEARQQSLQALFEQMTADVDGDWDFRLELRRSEAIGANAFALPGGVVILTDDLVNIAANDAELQAVLAHEIGHVIGRHSLRMLLQNSFSALFTLAFLGDVSGTAAVVAAVPAVMVQARHSRQFETEADQFAVAWLERNGLERRLLRELLQRLEEAAGTEGSDFGFLSTHPQTDERGR